MKTADVNGVDFNATEMFYNWFFAPLVAVGLLGNLAVVVIIYRVSKLRSFGHYAILNLAVTDFVFSITALFTYLANGIPGGWEWPELCVVTGVVGLLSCIVSIFTLLAIAIERYLLIVRSVQTSAKWIPLTWFGAWWLSSLPLYGVGGFELQSINIWCTGDWKLRGTDMAHALSVLSGLSMATVVIVLCYFRIWQKIKEVTGSLAKSETTANNERTATKRMVVIVIAFFLCWTPCTLYVLYELIAGKLLGPWLTFLADIGVDANPAINPFIYAYFDPVFKTEMKRFLSCQCGSIGADQTESSGHSHQKSAPATPRRASIGHYSRSATRSTQMHMSGIGGLETHVQPSPTAADTSASSAAGGTAPAGIERKDSDSNNSAGSSVPVSPAMGPAEPANMPPLSVNIERIAEEDTAPALLPEDESSKRAS